MCQDLKIFRMPHKSQTQPHSPPSLSLLYFRSGLVGLCLHWLCCSFVETPCSDLLSWPRGQTQPWWTQILLTVLHTHSPKLLRTRSQRLSRGRLKALPGAAWRRCARRNTQRHWDNMNARTWTRSLLSGQAAEWPQGWCPDLNPERNTTPLWRHTWSLHG